MGWNETFQNFAAQMYDANGNIVYTLDPDVSNSISFRGYKNNNAETNYSKDYSAIILGQNYPNPFNPETEISYELQAAGYIRVGVYNLLGEEVSVLAEGKFAPGRYKVRFNGSNLASGVYFYELKVNGMRKDMKRMILVK